MEEKILIETGYEYLMGEGTIASSCNEKIFGKILNVSHCIFTTIIIEENLSYELSKTRRERRKKIYRFKGTRKDLKELKELIPEDNPYNIYVKELES